MQIITVLLIGVVLFACVVAVALAGPADAAATAFVRRQQVGANLQSLGFAAAQRTQTYAMLASSLGAAQAKALVSDALSRHAPQFQRQWDEHLATAYALHLNADELASLAAEGSRSRFHPKLREQQGAVGASMEKLSRPVLTEYVTAALNSVHATTAPKP